MPYNFIMVDHTIIKLVNMIKDLKILMCGIPFYVKVSTVAKADRSTNLRNEAMSMIDTYVVIHRCK
jgi:hypothetical protein